MINHDLTLYLMVTGYGDDPEMVTRVLGIAPTAAWIRGESYCAVFPEARRVRSQWMLGSGLPADAPFRDHCQALLAQLEPRADRVRLLAARCTVGIVCGSYYHTGDPAFFVDETLISRFHALGLEARFDQLPQLPE